MRGITYKEKMLYLTVHKRAHNKNITQKLTY